MQNSARHDNRWLTSVPSGTPKRLATVMPAIITATACALRPGPATRAATIDPTPKQAPCGSPDTNRIASSTP